MFQRASRTIKATQQSKIGTRYDATAGQLLHNTLLPNAPMLRQAPEDPQTSRTHHLEVPVTRSADMLYLWNVRTVKDSWGLVIDLFAVPGCAHVRVGVQVCGCLSV